MIDVLVYFSIILLCAFPFVFLYCRQELKKERQKIFDEEVKNINIFKVMNLDEYDRFIKEDDDPTIRAYDVFNQFFDLGEYSVQDLVDFLRVHKDHINWYHLCMYVVLPIEVIEEFIDYIDWFAILLRQKLPESFIRRYKEQWEMKDILVQQQVSEQFLRDYLNEFKKQEWIYISRYQKLNEQFIREFRKKVKWNIIAMYQNVSRDFINEFNKKIDWKRISMETLTEEYMEKYKDKLIWVYVTEASLKNMSDEFILKMEDYIEWRELWLHKAVMSDVIRAKAKEKLGSWLHTNEI